MDTLTAVKTVVWMLEDITLRSLYHPLIDNTVPLHTLVIYFNSDITSIIVFAKSSIV